MDPGIALEYDYVAESFTVEAKTGIAVWTWLDYPVGPVIFFENNGFLLLPGRKREVGVEVKGDGTEGEWVGGLEVGSLWDITLKR